MKCAIVITQVSKDILSKYDLLIGVEEGVRYIKDIDKDKIYISDFDSIDINLTEDIDQSLLIKLDHYSKDYTDGEEAIKYALDKGYTSIDVYCNKEDRADHLLTWIYIVNKYNIKYISDSYIVESVLKDKVNTYSRYGNKLSAYVFTDTHIKSKGLRWEVDRTFDVKSITTFISNEVIDSSFELETDNEFVIIQSIDEKE